MVVQGMVLCRKPWTRPILLKAPPVPHKDKTSTNEQDKNKDRDIEEEGQPKEQPYEALLVILPDVTVRPEAYVPLAKLLQEKAVPQAMTLHVGIARLFGVGGVWGQADAQANITQLLQLLSQQSDRAVLDHVFVLGHGKGAASAMATAPYTGLIRFGSIDNSNNHQNKSSSSLASFPKPCLTLLGDQDGQIPYLRLAGLLDELEEAQNNEEAEDVPIPKPILLMPDLNHNCLVDPIFLKNQHVLKDLPLRNNMTHEIALDQVACVSVNFVRIILGGKRDELNELQKLTQHTQRRLEPYRKLVQRQAVADLARKVQQAIYAAHSPPRDDDPTHANTTTTGSSTADMPCTVTVQFVTSVLDFAFTKPQIGDSFVRVFVYNQGPLRNEKKKVVLWSGTWAVKCKSQATLRLAFENDASGLKDGPEDFPDVFREINRQNFEHVLHHVVTDAERVRYQKHGLKLDFGPDCELMSSKTKRKSSLTWILSDLLLTPHDATGGWTVATPSAYTTSSERLPAKFRGMHYGKILSPAQCYEWIVSGCWRVMAENSV
eukprot:scaffold6480_cov165-Amphora_coffeaeformis.AAC.10